jgi:hypothetical protein
MLTRYDLEQEGGSLAFQIDDDSLILKPGKDIPVLPRPNNDILTPSPSVDTMPLEDSIPSPVMSQDNCILSTTPKQSTDISLIWSS